MSAPPLLRLMDGKKTRPRKAPRTAPKESVLHIAVANTLRDHALPEWQWTHVPSGELRDMRTAVKLKRMGVRRDAHRRARGLPALEHPLRSAA